MLALIGNVLEIARIESGKETLNEAPWNLMKLEETLDILLDGEISRKQLTVNRNVNIRHANVYCDALKIREIIMNLLSNAVKYTSEGGKIVLDIDEKPSARDGFITLQIRVSDNGIGISKEYVPYIFDAFTRERSSSESGIMHRIPYRLHHPFLPSLHHSMGTEYEGSLLLFQVSYLF